MDYLKYLILTFFVSFLSADYKNAQEILLKSLHRLDGINHSFKLNSINIDKKKEKHYMIYVNWPQSNKILSEIGNYFSEYLQKIFDKKLIIEFEILENIFYKWD